MNVERAIRQLTQDSTALQTVVKEMANSGLNHLKKLMNEAKNVFYRANGARKAEYEGEARGTERLICVFELMTELLHQLPASSHSLNVQEMRDWLQEVVTLEFDSLEAKVTRAAWGQLKTTFVRELLGWVKTLAEKAGSALGLPVFLKFFDELFTSVSDLSDVAVECMTACLYSLGSLVSQTGLQYIKRAELISSIRSKLVLLQSSDSVTLDPAKKLRSRKVGNSHQTRRHKVMMRRDERRKLALLGPRQSEQSSVDLNSLKLQFQLLAALIITRQSVDLSDLIMVDIDKLDPIVLKPFARVLVLSAHLDSSHKRYTEFLLSKLKSRQTFRVLASEWLFSLSANCPL